MRNTFRSTIAILALALAGPAFAADVMPTQAKLDFMRGAIPITAPYATGVANTVYTVGTRVQNAAKIYELTGAMAGNSTTAPTGTTLGATSTDNSGTWNYIQPAPAYKMALHTSAASANMVAAATKQASLGNEVAAAGGYSTGGSAVTLSAVAVSGTSAQLTMATITWSTSTITARYGVLYDSTTDRIVAIFDFGSDKISTSGDFTLTSSAGVVAIN